MPHILAENITGWLIAAAVFFGGLLAALLALGAIIPAFQGNRKLTLALISPAALAVVLATLWIGYGYLTDGLHDPDYSIDDFLIPWSMFAGPPLVAGLLAVFVLWLKMRQPRT